MNFSINQIKFPEESAQLVDFLTGDTWPFHVNCRLRKARVLQMLADREFDGSDHRSFWIKAENEIVGFLRIFDLNDVDDGFPLLDLRILSSARGSGAGTAAIKWMTRLLFNEFPKLDKIAGTTRADNLGMRKLFAKCGFVKEGHYRNDWDASNGESYDTVKYSVLRSDWASGKKTPVDWYDLPEVDR